MILKQRQILFILLIIIGFIYGCDFGCDYSFEVENLTDKEIISKAYGWYTHEDRFDTILPNETKQIYAYINGGYGKHDKAEDLDDFYMFDSICFYINDTIKSFNDYKDKNFWEFTSKTRLGIYKTSIDCMAFDNCN